MSFRPGAPSLDDVVHVDDRMPSLAAFPASALTFSTTFCPFACSGEPEFAKAPPSMMTSFCRSWMIRTQRLTIQAQGFVSHFSSYCM